MQEKHITHTPLMSTHNLCFRDNSELSDKNYTLVIINFPPELDY